MKIVVGSDHAGYLLKEKIKEYLLSKNEDVVDVGTYSQDSCDYPDFGIKAAEKVASKEVDFGIVVCGSAEGISISANKVKGIRCAIGYNDEVTELSRLHNDANMIAFAERFMDENDVLRRVNIFLHTEFAGDRHKKRVDKIINYENSH